MDDNSTDGVGVSASLEPLARTGAALQNLDRLAARFGRSISDAFAKGIVYGRSLEDVLRGLALRLTELALKAALRPLDTLLVQGIENAAKGLLGPLTGAASSAATTASARGNVFAAGQVRPFAQGGVIAAPTYFPLARGLGLAGERGPEAIVPLARGPDGKLGIRAEGGRPVNVTVNIATPDVEGFRRSQAQVAAALARAVARGRRAL